MLTIILLLTLLNTALLGFLIRTLANRPVQPLHRTTKPTPRKSFQPIRHPRIAGLPTLPVSLKVDSGAVLSYYNKRGDTEAEPFVAMYFKESGIFDGTHIQTNSYLILDSSAVLPAKDFESAFEQARVAYDIRNSPKAKAMSQRTITAEVPKEAPVLSEEDARRLAEEYELVDRTAKPAV